MKVAMVTPYWFPVRGGVTTYVAELSAELRRSFAVDVHILAREGGAAGATALGGDARAFARRAVGELERIAPDVVHAHGHWYALLAAVRYRAAHPGVRVVFTLHTEFPRASRFRRTFLRRLLSRADFLTAVSADLLERTLRAYRPRTRTRVTRPGTSASRPSPARMDAVLRETGLVGRRPVLAFVGPLAYERKTRGVARAIRAMKAIRARHPDAVLAIAGDGQHRPWLEAIAAAEAPGAVAFLGNVDDPLPLMAAADLYLHVSFQEGLPLAVLEAMACGTPVVATPVGGIPEILADGVNGVLVSGDPDEIAARVLDLLASPVTRDRLTTAASEGVVARLTWRKAARKFHEVYGGRTPHRLVVTVDLERDYHAPGDSFRGVEEALPKILGLLDKHGVRAHFFATSDLCARHPDALRDIVRRGHILGCHGESHDVTYLSSRPYRWQVASIRRATDALEACTGVRPRGFRAPNFSADGATIRALERLGYAYDASVLPGRVVREKRVLPRVDFLAAPRDPYRPARSHPALPGTAALVEFPVTENPLAPGGPIGLGFLHANGVERTLEAVERSPGSPRVFLVHPWELVDPPPGAIPAWMRTACSSDASILDAFLDNAKQRYGFATFEEEPEESIRPEDWREGDARSDARPPVSLLLVTNVYAPVVGGITSYVGNLHRALGDRFRTRILAYPTVLVRFEAAHPRHVLRWFVHVAFGGYAFLRVLADRLRGRDVIVHSHSAAFCLVAGYLGRLVGARAVHTFHSPLGYHSRTLEFASHRLDALVYVSPATRTNYVDASETWNDRERILPGAVDLAPEVTEDERRALRKRFERSLGVPSDHALVLSAGRVVEDKGIHVLARAAGMLAGERISVVVAGPPGRTSADRRYVEGLRALADPGGRFQLLGEVSREMLHDLFRAADVVAIPSVWAEPAPMSAVEAMAHGRPVVASRIGGLPFLVPDGVGGILVPPGDASALADALRTIARDGELRSRLSRGARARAEERHALGTFGLEHARLYGSL